MLASISSTSRSTISTSAMTKRAEFPDSSRRSSLPSGDAHPRDRQHSIQHCDQERQPRSDSTARSARRGAWRGCQLQRLHGHEERKSRFPSGVGGGNTGRGDCARTLGLQAPSPRCDHELGLLPRAHPTVHSGRDAGALPSGIRTIHIDPAGQVKRCPDFPTDFHWTRLPNIQAGELQCVLLRLSRGGEGSLLLSRMRDIMA